MCIVGFCANEPSPRPHYGDEMTVVEKRQIRFEGDLAFVPLTKGHEAVIDAADAPLVSGVNWNACEQKHGVYAVRQERRAGKQIAIRMHRLIMQAPDGMQVDHINGDGLDNRRANLRLASHTENNRNTRTPINNTSGFKGVAWHAANRKWRAYIKVENRQKYLGLFATAEAAHAAYCLAADQFHGNFGSPG